MRSSLVAALVLVAAPSLADEWVSIDDPDFVVQLPGTPKRSESSGPSDVGETRGVTYEYEGEGGGVYFAVNYTDFPEGKMTNADPGKVLDGARKGALDNTRAKPLGSTAVWLEAGGAKYPGTEFEGKTPDKLKVSARVFLVKDRLYQLIHVRQFATPADADFRAFVASFKLKGDGVGGAAQAAEPRAPGKHRPAPSRHR